MANSVSVEVGKTIDWKELAQKSNEARMKKKPGLGARSSNMNIISYNNNHVSTSDADRVLAPRSDLDLLLEDRDPVWLSRTDSPLLRAENKIKTPKRKLFKFF